MHILLWRSELAMWRRQIQRHRRQLLDQKLLNVGSCTMQHLQDLSNCRQYSSRESFHNVVICRNVSTATDTCYSKLIHQCSYAIPCWQITWTCRIWLVFMYNECSNGSSSCTYRVWWDPRSEQRFMLSILSPLHLKPLDDYMTLISEETKAQKSAMLIVASLGCQYWKWNPKSSFSSHARQKYF